MNFQKRPRAAYLGPAARRPLVLDAALNVWVDKGLPGVTMAAIAHEAGVSKPVLYECFTNKEAVLFALLEREEERLLSSALAAVPTSIADPERDVAQAYVSFFNSVLAHPQSWRVVFDAQRTLPGVVGRRYRAARMQVISQIATVLHIGGLTDRYPSEAERLVIAEHMVLLAETHGWKLLQPEVTWTQDDLAQLVAKFVMTGLA